MQEERIGKKEKSLRLYHNGRGLIRSKTRISEIYVFMHNHPIVLRDKSRFTKWLVLRAHTRTWNKKCVLDHNGRQVVKHILKKCVICNISNKMTLLLPSTPGLPKFRVSYKVPFEVAGIDYAGPDDAKTSQDGRIGKCYMLLITCVATRVHLERTSYFSSGPLILVFRRFTPRQGASKLFISDNVKTFKCSKAISEV